MSLLVITLKDVVSLVSPTILVAGVIVGAARWLWHAFERRLDTLDARLDRIETQTTKTNGRVSVLETNEKVREAKLDGFIAGRNSQ